MSQRVVAIIQARLDSTRLPNKVLLPLAGKSMLQNVIERVKRAKNLDRVIVATTGIVNRLGEICFECKVPAADWYGDENDLIGRYSWCARAYRADYVVRIGADNPCVEPEAIDSLVEFGLDSD